jgi:hypothetical protein
MRIQGRTGLVLAFVLGAVVATAGTATAAKLITGKQIKNGSIAKKDLSKAVRTALAERAEPGAQGIQGPQGPKGDKGDPAVVPAPQAPIEVTSLSNGWQKFGESYRIRYWKDGFGVVHLMGGLTGGTVSTGTDSVTVFRLPAGYRPSQIQYFPAVSTDSSNVAVGGGYIEVCGPPVCTSDEVGNVAVFAPADNFYVSLDGITFRAG